MTHNTMIVAQGLLILSIRAHICASVNGNLLVVRYRWNTLVISAAVAFVECAPKAGQAARNAEITSAAHHICKVTVGANRNAACVRSEVIVATRASIDLSTVFGMHTASHTLRGTCLACIKYVTVYKLSSRANLRAHCCINNFIKSSAISMILACVTLSKSRTLASRASIFAR